MRCVEHLLSLGIRGGSFCVQHTGNFMFDRIVSWSLVVLLGLALFLQNREMRGHVDLTNRAIDVAERCVTILIANRAIDLSPE